MRISDWSSDVCSSDLLAGRDAEKGVPSWARSHPLTQDRVARARREAAGGTAKTRNRDVFLNALDGTIYDDDPKQGVVDGRVFRHPDLKFQFEAPAGFTRSEEHTSELQSLMRISYAVFCLKKKQHITPVNT